MRSRTAYLRKPGPEPKIPVPHYQGIVKYLQLKLKSSSASPVTTLSLPGILWGMVRAAGGRELHCIILSLLPTEFSSFMEPRSRVRSDSGLPTVAKLRGVGGCLKSQY